MNTYLETRALAEIARLAYIRTHSSSEADVGAARGALSVWSALLAAVYNCNRLGVPSPEWAVACLERAVFYARPPCHPFYSGALEAALIVGRLVRDRNRSWRGTKAYAQLRRLLRRRA